VNRAQRRQATKEFQAQLQNGSLAGAVDLANVPQAPKRITLGYLVDEVVKVQFLRSVMATASQSQSLGFMIRPRDVEVTVERSRALNLLLKSFLQTEDEFLLVADTNVAFAPQDVAMLIAADAAIAGALYFTAATGQESWPTAWVERDIEPEGDGTANPAADYGPVPLPTPPEDLTRPDPAAFAADDDGAAAFQAADAEYQSVLADWATTLAQPIPVDGVGFGLVLIKREVVARMVEAFEWPFEAIRDRREDLTFCLRAAVLSFQTVVVPAARVGHMRQGMI
jgi:hypothetical protein